MKTTILNKNCIYKTVQEFIDNEIRPLTVAVAYNEDTAELDYSNYKTIQVMEAGKLLSNRFNFDIPIDSYINEPIDLAVVGIGYKGQIGFNEIATPFDSTKHFQKLTDSTKEEYSAFGNVPDEGITLGISDICNAKNIIVIATGKKRSEAVFNMLYGRNDSTCPAAFLQIPLNVYVFADNEAAEKL